MKRQFNSMLSQCRMHLLICCLLGGTMILNVQKSQGDITTPGDDSGSGVSTAAAGGGGPGQVFVYRKIAGSGQIQGDCMINGLNIGSVILTNCDLDHDGAVSLTELKQVATACFKLWDTNSTGNLSQEGLSNGLQQFFPKVHVNAMCVINGVAVQVPPDQMPTPYGQLAKHIMALADANKDGLISLQELNDFLDKSFSQWDQNSNGSLDAQELANAFGQLALPDPPP